MRINYYKKIVLFIFCVVMGSYFFVVSVGVYFNLYSDSLPYGIYLRTNETPGRGSYVAACLTEAIAKIGLQRGYLPKGRCDTGIRPVLKKVVGVEGDTITVVDQSVFINGKIVSDSVILKNDSAGRPLQRFYADKTYLYLKRNDYWLMSNYKPNSWDSRYWGIVDVEFALKPLWVWGD